MPYRRIIMGRTGGLLLLVVAMACSLPSKRNPAACCTTQEDCDFIGLPLGSDCGEGLACESNFCVQAVCQANSDCDVGAPFCGPAGLCVDCLDSTQCGDQVCDTATGSCRACSIDADCPDGFCHMGACRSSIVPKYLPNVCDVAAAMPELTITTSLDTDDDASCTQLVAQPGGPDVCVIHYGTISLEANVEILVTGNRVLALVADDSLSLDGVLDVGAAGLNNGPGGRLVVSGGAATAAGGGGAGFRTQGGAGGTTLDGGAANGGAAQTDPASSLILQGGTRSGGASGGAGGAATLISCHGTVSVTGTLDAGGGGGRGGRDSAGGLIGGSGGGSGGYVVLQGAAVLVTGQIYSNGGGGGAGKPSVGAGGAPGGNGQRTQSPAPGGAATSGEGAGGAGAAGAGSAGIGGRATAAATTGGGGGASAGFFQTYTPTGVTPTLTPTVASPGFETNLEIPTR